MSLILRLVASAVLLTFSIQGCKEKPVALPPAKVAPMPKKQVQQKLSSAKQQASTVTQLQVAGQQRMVGPAAVAAGMAVQRQASSAKMPSYSASVTLNFANRRDPFKPFIQAPSPQAPVSKSVKKVKDLLPIQSYDTEKFRVSGIITGVRQNSALVIDPKGKGYVVREGMLIGSNDGRVKRITNSSVEVEESFRDDSGKVKKRVVKLSLIRKQ